MAQYNEILEGGLNQVIVKRLGMQTGTAVPAVQPEMTMDLTLESDRPEWGYFKGEYRWARSRITAIPAAGNHAIVALENFSNSGMLCVVESVWANVQARISMTQTLTGFVGSDGGFPRDGRQPARSRNFVGEYNVLTANLPTLQGWINAATECTTPFIVPPGWYFTVAHPTTAASITAHIMWRERPVLPGELG